MLADDDSFMDKIEDIRPHVVLLDFKLDGRICIEMCRQIKAKYPHLPVLALSCNSNIDIVYNKHEFDGYIKKPFDLDLLYRILKEHLVKSDGLLDRN
jgi:DNA-binding response OmpR family regulator